MIDKKKLQNIIETIGIRKLLLILALGICLMVFSVPSPEKSQKEDAAKETQDEEDSTDDYVRKQEERLVKALKQVEGVGKVKVMITVKSSSEAVVNKDSPYEESTGKEEKSVKEDEESVLIEEDGKKVPYVIKELQPEVEGVVVVAQGGGDALIQKNITEVIQALFDIEAHKIKVVKMK